MLFVYYIKSNSGKTAKQQKQQNSKMEKQVLENGLLIEEIPFEMRTDEICINALKWALKIYSTTDYKICREVCFRIMRSFPSETLLTGFVMGHLSHFA